MCYEKNVPKMKTCIKQYIFLLFIAFFIFGYILMLSWNAVIRLEKTAVSFGDRTFLLQLVKGRYLLKSVVFLWCSSGNPASCHHHSSLGSCDMFNSSQMHSLGKVCFLPQLPAITCSAFCRRGRLKFTSNRLSAGKKRTPGRAEAFQ